MGIGSPPGRPTTLARFLVHTAWVSRAHLDDVLRRGRVTVDGVVSRLGTEAVTYQSDVRVDGRSVLSSHPLRHRSPEHPPLALLVNKRSGDLVTRVGPSVQKSIIDPRIEQAFPLIHPYLTPVNRISPRASGLVLLVADADFAWFLRQRLAVRFQFLSASQVPHDVISTLANGDPLSMPPTPAITLRSLTRPRPPRSLFDEEHALYESCSLSDNTLWMETVLHRHGIYPRRLRCFGVGQYDLGDASLLPSQFATARPGPLGPLWRHFVECTRGLPGVSAAPSVTPREFAAVGLSNWVYDDVSVDSPLRLAADRAATVKAEAAMMGRAEYREESMRRAAAAAAQAALHDPAEPEWRTRRRRLTKERQAIVHSDRRRAAEQLALIEQRKKQALIDEFQRL